VKLVPYIKDLGETRALEWNDKNAEKTELNSIPNSAAKNGIKFRAQIPQ